MVLLAKRFALYILYISIIALLAGWGVCVCFAQDAQAAPPPAPENPANNLCYTCHLGLKTEEITAKHIAHNIACTMCHGPSVEHMHDEMQVTRPDILYGRGEVVRMCSACHPAHEDPNKVEAFRAEWLGKTRPNGRVITQTSICTDCHGSHNYITKQTPNAASTSEDNWQPLFNGENLDGWQTSNPNPAAWSVKTGRIIGKSIPDADARLYTKDRYADFRLSMTFQTGDAAHPWISLADIDPNTQLRLDLFDRPEKGIYAPTLSINGKAIVLANLKKDLMDRLGWNTVIVELKADACAVTVNGEKVGSVRIENHAKSPVGIHMEKSNKAGQISISEIYLQRIPTKGETS